MNLVVYLAAINLLTFALYGLDKRAARHHAARVPEYILLLFGFAGGTIAAIIAQHYFRHKTKKLSYKLRFWALTIVQIGLLMVQPGPVRTILHHLS